MKTRHKIIIDNLLGKPLVFVLNVLARTLGFILNIDHSLERPYRKIVVAKYVGLGSIIQATPLLRTLRENYPDAQITFVSSGAASGILKNIPEVDQTLSISDKNIFKVFTSTLRLVFDLWKIKPDLYIDLEFYSNYSSIIATVSKATNRLGFYKKDKAYRKGIYNYLFPFNVNTPVSLTYLQFAKAIGCKKIITDLKIQITNGEWETITAKLNLRANDLYVVINPNASDLRLERRWPKESYISLLRSLAKDFNNVKFVLIGNKSEAEYVQEIESPLRGAHPNIINSAGHLTLPELISLISQTQLMITNDTGPMHIAFALHKKTISLFGPCSPLQYGGPERAITFYKNTPCSPCVHKQLVSPCKGDNICMKLITDSEVLRAAKQSLEAAL